jgi:molybdate transport system substrate-binding protein
MSLPEPITCISSMATRAVLADLARAYETRSGHWVAIESVGGVDAARRVRAGEPFDVVVLARDAIDKLATERRLVAATTVDLVRSGVAVAVQAGSPRPRIDTEAALRDAVLAASSVGISTGPSGVQLQALFERWGIAGQLRDRIVIATPGVPVGSLLARGEVALAFQQRSELSHLDGIDVLGPLPAPIQIVTTFAAALGVHTRQSAAARALLAFLTSPAAVDAKRRHGMDPPEVDSLGRELAP